MAIAFGWLKRLFDRSTPTGRLTLQPGVQLPTWRKGKSALADKVAAAITASGAEPGDIVEVDEQGAARVVGRLPRIAGVEGDHSEHAIRGRIRAIYGDDAAHLVDVSHGSNVVVFRNQQTA